MLKDRLIEFSDAKEEEWNLLKSKVGSGIELPLPDSERWFYAEVDGDNIRVEGAKLNVRPLKLYKPCIINFDEFKQVSEIYNDSLLWGINNQEDKLRVQKTITNTRYIFMLIYHLL